MNYSICIGNMEISDGSFNPMSYKEWRKKKVNKTLACIYAYKKGVMFVLSNQNKA